MGVCLWWRIGCWLTYLVFGEGVLDLFQIASVVTAFAAGDGMIVQVSVEYFLPCLCGRID